jgi:hypothetical protein
MRCEINFQFLPAKKEESFIIIPVGCKLHTSETLPNTSHL